MSLSQCLLSLHMFRNRYWPCTHTHAYNKTETRIFCFRSFISSKVTANWNRVGSKYVILGSHARNSNENGEQDNDAARSLHVFIHDSNPESSFSLIRGSEASDQFRSPKRQSSLKMYVPLSLCLKPIKILNMGRDNKLLKLEMLYFFFYPSVANKEQRESKLPDF